MAQVVTFGEAMIRLVPPDFQRLEQAGTLRMTAGGSEFNVAVGLARLGVPAAWVTVLPDDPLGRFTRNKAREQGVDTSHVYFSDQGRMGKYFVEFGSSPRASRVYYDREGSSISLMDEKIEWGKALEGAAWFHTSGITPALSEKCAVETRVAVEAAKQAGCTVSYDLNYRKKLWSPEEARKTTAQYIDRIDCCIGNEEDFQKVLGIESGEKKDFESIEVDYYAALAEKVQKQYGFSSVAISLRESVSVLRNSWKGLLYTGGRVYVSREYQLELIDRVGGGDSFSAGLLYAFRSGMKPQDAVEFAAAFSALKHTIAGDVNIVDLEEVQTLLKSSTARIER
jgi:2-dehydro-3-deoxygluconokinase